MSTPKPAAAFTARETELLTIAFQCLKSKPDIDYTLMAVKANLKGAKSARDSFGPLYNKIVAGKFGDTAATAAASSPAKGSPLKRKDVDDDDDEDEVASASPLKKAKKAAATPRKGKGSKSKGGKKEEKAEEDGNGNGNGVGVDEDDDNIVVKAEVLDENNNGGAGEED